MWPAEIIAYNEKYKNKESFEKYKLPGETLQKPLDLPYDVPANKILLYKGHKMSKGDHSNIPLDELLERFSPDLMRYFTTRFAPENHDRDFVWKDIIDLNNNELVANIGNFINRTVSFTNSKFAGVVPARDLDKKDELDETVEAAIKKAFTDISEHLEHTEFVRAIDDLLELGHFANKYFNDAKPWERIKDQKTERPKESKETAENTLFNCIQIVSAYRTLLKPILPFAADRIATLLNTSDEYDANKELEKTGFVTKHIDTWKFQQIPAGHKIGETIILFEKLEYTKDLEEVDSFDPNKGETVTTDSIKFTQAEELTAIPVITTCIKGVKVKKLDQKVDAWIKIQEEEIKRIYSDKNWKSSPLFAGYNSLHNKYSTNLTFATASENLIELVLKNGTLPRVNNIVDIYNAISAKYGVSMGVHDISKLEGQPKLEILAKDIEYMTIGGKFKDTAKKGEFAYTDNKSIICRMDVKQCDRTKVNEKSKDLFIILQGHDYLGEGILKKALDELIAAYQKLVLS
jgi:methionyl-tRNA synthetase